MDADARTPRSVSRGWQVGLLLLAGVFTVGLTFASIELPRLAHEVLAERVGLGDAPLRPGAPEGERSVPPLTI